ADHCCGCWNVFIDSDDPFASYVICNECGEMRHFTVSGLEKSSLDRESLARLISKWPCHIDGWGNASIYSPEILQKWRNESLQQADEVLSFMNKTPTALSRSTEGEG